MNGKVILLIEDNPDDVALTLDAFRSCNLANQIDVVGDGAEALDYLFHCGRYHARTESPSLVLLDLKLPKVDGFDVLRRMRSDPVLKCIPVVVLTTSTEQEDVLGSYNLGANSYVRKPVDFDQFLNAVRQVGMYWLLLNEAAVGQRHGRQPL